MDACSTQDEVDEAYAAWLFEFGYTGGMDVVNEDLDGNTGAPSYCGGEVTIDYSVYDACSQDGCSATFSVDYAPTLLAVCPDDMTMDACPTQDEVDAAFALWLEGFSYTGGCNVIENFEESLAGKTIWYRTSGNIILALVYNIVPYVNCIDSRIVILDRIRDNSGKAEL
jgi:hypothetical protein